MLAWYGTTIVYATLDYTPCVIDAYLCMFTYGNLYTMCVEDTPLCIIGEFGDKDIGIK